MKDYSADYRVLKDGYRQLSIYIYTEPVGKGRPRFTRNGRTYTPVKTRESERFIKRCVEECIAELDGFNLITSAMAIQYYAFMPMPKSWSKNKKASMDREPHTSRPDVDNLAKLALDALNGVAYKDDALIYRMESVKIYTLDDPFIFIEIQWREEEGEADE